MSIVKTLVAEDWLNLPVLAAFGVLVLCSSSVMAADFQSDLEEREFRAAMGLLKDEDYELARQQFRRFLETYSQSPARGKAYYGLAETYYRQDYFDSAPEFYRKALSAGSLDTPIRQAAVEGLFRSVRKARRPEAALKFLQNADTTVKSMFSDTDYVRVYRLIDNHGDSETAMTFAKRQLERNPEDGHWKYRLAVQHARRKNFDQALPLLNKLGEPGTRLRFDATLTKADVLFEQGHYDDAEYRYRFLLRNDVHRDEARYGLAWIFIERENLQSAKDLLSLVTHARGQLRAKAARDLARIFRQQDEAPMAQPWYKKAIEWAGEPLKSNLKAELESVEQSASEG